MSHHKPRENVDLVVSPYYLCGIDYIFDMVRSLDIVPLDVHMLSVAWSLHLREGQVKISNFDVTIIS